MARAYRLIASTALLVAGAFLLAATPLLIYRGFAAANSGSPYFTQGQKTAIGLGSAFGPWVVFIVCVLLSRAMFDRGKPTMEIVFALIPVPLSLVGILAMPIVLAASF